MPTGWAGIGGAWDRLRGAAPEVILALVALASFGAALGRTELWGRREQRAAAEAVDTVDRGHWLVGELQGRPRLEKPPLPRWVAAALMAVSGRRDEAIVRLPSALAALGLVGLAVAWGRAVGGRAVGLAAGFALAATPAFVVEMRQAGVDPPLALCAGLALHAALRRWGPGWDEAGATGPGHPAWAFLVHLAVGLGFLCKGPVIFLWVGLPVAGFLLSRRRLGTGLRLLAHGSGGVVLAILVVAWPLAVAVRHPAAVGVWVLELGQKTGTLGVEHGNSRGPILVDALALTLPWTPLVIGSLVAPLRRWRAGTTDATSAASGLAWWWAFGPLAILGTWDDPKPSYLLPALPAAAILAADGWLMLARRARDLAGGASSRLALQVAWSGLFALGVATPVVVHELAPDWFAPALAAGAALALAAPLSARCWHLGRDSASLGAVASGLVAASLVAFGIVAPTENPARGHRRLAAELTRLVPAGAPAWFLDDLEDGVWFYGPTLDLHPVPMLAADRPATNRGHALRAGVAANQTRAAVARKRVDDTVDRLRRWADAEGPGATLLIRGKLLDHLGADLPPSLAPVYRESNVRRADVAVLRVRSPAGVATRSVPTRR